MKIYTKKGDRGKTQLLGGGMVDKFHPRVVAYGDIDELNAFIGNIHDQLKNNNHKDFLIFIQKHLLNLGSIISFNGQKEIKLPEVTRDDVCKIEREIDDLEKDLEKLTEFILPCGHPISSLCHIARTVCRRAERSTALLSTHERIGATPIMFLNRLSDYLFVLSRSILKENNQPERYWK